MKLQHRVQINVANPGGGNQSVLKSRGKRVSQRLLRLLFGQYSEVLILKAGKTVTSVEIHETHQGGTSDEKQHATAIDR